MKGTKKSQLELARSLVAHLEANESDDANLILAQLAGVGDSLLFREVGRLARELHTSINEFLLDARLADLTRHDIPDAAARLRYVISMTEQAANTTLASVEKSLPLADDLRSDAAKLSAQWRRFNSRQLSVEDFRELSSELQAFFDASQANASALHDNLTEVLMAQGFQDLTGQIIRKVIALVGDLEEKLVELLRISGRQQLAENKGRPGDKSSSKPADSSLTAEGPAVPGVDENDVVAGQDEVDDLLSSLGF
jgi:chemotaxis protein CheZ